MRVGRQRIRKPHAMRWGLRLHPTGNANASWRHLRFNMGSVACHLEICRRHTRRESTRWALRWLDVLRIVARPRPPVSALTASRPEHSGQRPSDHLVRGGLFQGEKRPGSSNAPGLSNTPFEIRRSNCLRGASETFGRGTPSARWAQVGTPRPVSDLLLFEREAGSARTVERARTARTNDPRQGPVGLSWFSRPAGARTRPLPAPP